MFDLSLYSGHNASFTIAKDGQILEIVEIERFTNTKNAGLLWYIFAYEPLKVIVRVLEYFKVKYNVPGYENLITNQDDVKILVNLLKSEKGILNFFNAQNLIQVFHQQGHSAGAFYQSNLYDAIIVSFDGGGNDGCFNFYKCDRKNGLELIEMNYDYNIGEKYAEIGHYCSSIRKDTWSNAYLVYAGKLMGLAGYGEVVDDYVPVLQEYYKGHHMTKETRTENYNYLKNTLKLPDELSGELEKNLVRTSQHVFEDIFMNTTTHIREMANNNLILTGGCALNILNNTAVNNQIKTFVPPNPNDCGLSLGFMLHYLQPSKQVDATYKGPEVWDKQTLSEHLYNTNATIDTDTLIEDILKGSIIGIVNGGSEIGPRALGNRSIICYPGIEDMKDILNEKVKNREYYRPFAPVVRLEDVNKFFEFNQESRWMSFSPKVRPEYRDKLKSITHVDNTARVQTVTQEQNEYLYELLTKLDEKTGIGVLLNTSFNVAGKPILNTYRDAFYILENTRLDGLVLEKYYIKK